MSRFILKRQQNVIHVDFPKAGRVAKVISSIGCKRLLEARAKVYEQASKLDW